MDPRSLNVRKGDLVLPAWRRLLEVLGSFRLRAGPGVLLRRSRLGVLVSARSALRGYTGAFPVDLQGDSVKVGEGYISGLLPLIDEVPLTGTDKKPQPSLKLRADRFDDTGRSWVCAVGKVDSETGKIIQPVKGVGKLELRVEQRDSLTDEDDTLAIKAIAMLKRPVREKQGFGTLHQIALFDYQHMSAKQNERWRHFFVPA